MLYFLIVETVELKLSPELAEFLAHLLHAMLFHGVGMSLIFMTNPYTFWGRR